MTDISVAMQSIVVAFWIMSRTCFLPFGGGTPNGPQNPKFWA